MTPRMALPSAAPDGNHYAPIPQTDGGGIKDIKTSVANGIFPAVPESVPGDEKVTTTEESASVSASEEAGTATPGSSEPTTKESDKKYESDDSDTDSVILENIKYPTDLELEKRKKKAERWARQANLHNFLVSDRLAALEEELAAFKQEMVPLKYTKQQEIPVDEVKERFEKLPPLAVEIRRMNWKSWRVKPVKRGKEKWEHVLEYYQEPGSVLEVLTESPNSGRRQISNDGSTGQQCPERLRIRGRTLMQTLDYITERDTYDKSHKVVILRPFKVLAVNADKIRDHLKFLEEMHSSSAESKKNSDDPGQATAQSEPTPAWETHEALVHLRLLVQFMDEDLKPIWEIQKGLKEGTLKGVHFADLWHVFERGALICTPGPRVQVFRLLNCTGGRDVLNFNGLSDGYASNHPGAYYRKRWTSGSLSIEAYHVAFDGLQHGPVLTYFCIPRYEGKRDISLLRVFPLSCARNSIPLRKSLLERGDKFLTLTEAIAHREYVGLTVVDHYSDDVAEQIDSQVIVDVELALQKMPGLEPEFTAGPVLGHDSREWQEHTSNLGSCMQEGCCSNDILLEDHCWDDHLYNNYFSVKNQTLLQPVHNGADLGEDRLLLPISVPGFILRNRKWKKLDIELLTEVTYHNSWDDLVINEEHKDKVLALVENHSHNQVIDKMDPAENMDLVRGKGKGLILLLHGEPGVGKTSTAECVADHTRRPLFPITCGDIGDTAELVESSLESHFQLAHKWGCVLLLDEADVFLQKRNRTDLQRNAIVSVFLRTLEYYSGILFLTTNRVGSIDQAFKSRIHVSLYYPRLDLDTTLQIWENSLRRLKSQYFAQKKVKLRVKSKGILKFAEEHWNELARPGTWPWNGRQIRNAFQTAMALAEYQHKDEVPILTREEFEKVAEASREFDSYLQTVYVKKTHADIAKKEQIRNDLYGLKKPAIKNVASTKPPKSTKSQQSRRKKQRKQDSSSEEEESEDDEEEEDEDEEEDEEESDEEDDSDEEDPDSEFDKARGSKASKKPVKVESDDEEDDVDEDEEEEEEEEEDEVRPRRGKKATAVKEKKAKDGPAKGKGSTKRDTSPPALRRRGTAGREEKKSSKSGGRK